MNKQKLRQHTIRILFLGFLLGAIVGCLFSGIYLLKDKTCENLKEDYDWLESSAKDCWNELRILDKKCWDASDCIDNPDLEGCHKNDCNFCCFNNCHLVMCAKDLNSNCDSILGCSFMINSTQNT